MNPIREFVFALSGAALFCAFPASASAVVVWNESGSGDLSNSQAAPTALALALGTNSVVGSVNGTGDSQDWLSVNVPAGFQLTSYVNSVYVSGDLQGFTGFQPGPAFVGSPFVAGSYAGFSHYGTGAQNGAFPPVNLVGVNLLPIMADPAQAPGALGFSPPLGAGTYTFLIQQLGGGTEYQFDFGVTAVPAPSALGLGALAGIGLLRRRAR